MAILDWQAIQDRIQQHAGGDPGDAVIAAAEEMLTIVGEHLDGYKDARPEFVELRAALQATADLRRQPDARRVL